MRYISRILFVLCTLISSFNTFSQDVGISNIVTQNSGCDLPYPQTVTVEITNYSGINLNVTINLSYQLNADPIVNQSENVALGGGATTTFTFAVAISSGLLYGTNTIVSSASTALDFNPSNDSFTKDFINDEPSDGGSVGPDADVCAGMNGSIVNLTGELGTILKWQSSVNNGASWTDIVNTTTSQSYTNLNTTTLYRVAVKNGSCPIAFSVPATITVNQIPPTPVASSNGPICEGTTLGLFASNEPGMNYAWTGPSGFSSSAQNPTIPNSNAAMHGGTYSVTNTLYGCVSLPGDVTVTINIVPPAVNPMSNSPVCENGALNLTSDLINPGIYSWTGPNGYTSSQQNPTITNVSPFYTGTYTVFVTSNGCVGPSSSTSVTINGKPITPFVTSNSAVCSGNALNLLTDTVTNAVYSWTGPNGYTSNMQNPVIANTTLADAGNYKLTVSVLGCSSNISSTAVYINPTPATPTPTSNDPVCEGNPINLFAGSVIGGIYNWSGPTGFTSSTQNPQIQSAQLNQAGNYTVLVTVNGCTSQPGTVGVIVNPSPAQPIVSNNSPICEGLTLNLFAATVTGATYAWTGPNNFTSNLQNPSIPNAVAFNEGNYILTLSFASCQGASESTFADIITEAGKGGQIFSESPDPTFAVCPEDNEGQLVLRNYEGGIDHWEYSRDEGVTWIEDFNTTDTYQYLNVPVTTWYRAVVSGCTTTNTSTLYALRVEYDACERIIVANLLTPNGDGKNDTWLIAEIEKYPAIDVRIFNRSGKEIYHNTAYDNSWDGSFEGKKLQDATFYYLMKVTGNDETLKGSINLLR